MDESWSIAVSFLLTEKAQFKKRIGLFIDSRLGPTSGFLRADASRHVVTPAAFSRCKHLGLPGSHFAPTGQSHANQNV